MSDPEKFKSGDRLIAVNGNRRVKVARKNGVLYANTAEDPAWKDYTYRLQDWIDMTSDGARHCTREEWETA